MIERMDLHLAAACMRVTYLVMFAHSEPRFAREVILERSQKMIGKF